MISCTSFSQSRNSVSRKLGSLTRANQITQLRSAFALFMLIWHVLLLGMLNNSFFPPWILVLFDIWFSLNLALYRKIKISLESMGKHIQPFIPEPIYLGLILFHLGAIYFLECFSKGEIIHHRTG